MEEDWVGRLDEPGEWVYRFRIEQRLECDERVLVVVRNRCIGNVWEFEYLTREGWESYDLNETWNPSKLISMSGFEMAHEADVVRRIGQEVKAALELHMERETTGG